MMKSNWDTKYLRILSRHPSHKIIRNNILVPEDKTAVLRLGSMSEGEYDIQINTAGSIERCANKLEMKKIFRSAAINTPEFIILQNNTCGVYTEGKYEFKSFEYLRQNYLDKNKSLLAKLTYRSKGAGMLKIDTYSDLIKFLGTKVIDNQERKGNAYYLEVFHNYSKEYRVHVSELGSYFYANRKMLKEEYTNSTDNWYRNDSNCVWYLESNNNFDKPSTWNDIVADCQRAREALGLDICCFDVKVNKEGNWKILEANSAPSFGDTNEKVSIVSTMYQAELLKLIHQKLALI